jgi:iron complex transport system substrate-binding protein
MLAVAVTVLLCGLLVSCGLSSGAKSARAGVSRTITDTIGRQVTVPQQVARVATIGTIPVMIGYVMAVGAQHTIVTRGGQGGPNGVGANGKQGFDKTEFYKITAPNVLSAPNVESAIMAPVDTEALLGVHPDVVIAPNLAIAQGAVNAGLPVVVLNNGYTGSAVKHTVDVMGALFDQQEVAAKYSSYLDDTAQKVSSAVAAVPDNQRPSALFLAFSPLRAPIYATNYLFAIAGAKSITADMPGNNVHITTEQLLSWNPDIIVVQQLADQQALYTDSHYASLNAVAHHRVYLIPREINGAAMMPLELDYLAKSFYPDRFTDLDLPAAVHAYFREFAGMDLTDEQVTEILNNEI